MKLLLDENLPHSLRHMLIGHDVFTVRYMGWQGILNGNLIAIAASNGFDALITRDVGFAYEHNPEQLPCSIFILRTRRNGIDAIKPLVPALLMAIDSTSVRAVTWIPPKS